MENRPLGRTNVSVSALCLGTMTWGEQNSESEAHAQLDYAFDHGVNQFDGLQVAPPHEFGLPEGVVGKRVAQGHGGGFVGGRFGGVVASRQPGGNRTRHERSAVDGITRRSSLPGGVIFVFRFFHQALCEPRGLEWCASTCPTRAAWAGRTPPWRSGLCSYLMSFWRRSARIFTSQRTF